jgi:hypothetical protein
MKVRFWNLCFTALFVMFISVFFCGYQLTYAQTIDTQENLILGKITDTSKVQKPIVARAVRLINTDGSLAGLAISDSNGNYRLTGVKPGTYTIYIPDEMELVKKKYVRKVAPTSLTVDTETGFSRNVDFKVKAPTKVPLVEVRVMDPNVPGVPISGAAIQYKPVVGTKAKVAKVTSPTSLTKLKPGCYNFSTSKLIGYYLPENQTTRLVCFDQYGPTGGGEGYQITFFQTKIEDSRCDKVAQTGIDDFWFCGKKVRDTLSTTHTQYAGYTILWKRITTKIAELRSSYGPTSTPEQVSIQSDRFGMDYVVKRLSALVSDTPATCPLPRVATAPTNGIANPDEAERIAFSIDSFGYPLLDATKKKLQPEYQKQVDAQVAYLWAYTRDWRAGGCKNFASRMTGNQFNTLYMNLRTNYPSEMDDALNLNRMLGTGEQGLYPAPLRHDDPAQVYATAFAIGSTMKANFDANIKEGLNNHNSTKYKAGASDALKTIMTEVLKKQ